MILSIIIVIGIIQLSTLYFLYIMKLKDGDLEQKRFREFVKAIKAEDLQEYTSSIPEEIKIPEKIPDELVDLDEVAPEKIIKALE